MKRMLTGVVIATVVFTMVGLAQQITPSGQFILNLDYAAFRNNDSTGYLEIYQGFYPRLISYVARDSQYYGYLKVNTRISEKSTNAIVVDRQSGFTVPLSDTSSASFRSMLVNQDGYVLPFGEYLLRVLVVDSLTPSRLDSIVLPFVVKPYDANAVSSDLELCSRIGTSDQKDQLFYKNALEVIPNPTLVFGSASHPMMFSYAEVYNLDPEQTYTVKTQVIAQDGKVVKETSKAKKYGVRNAVEIGTTNAGLVQSGKYLLRLMIVDGTGNTVAQTDKVFYANNPHIQRTPGSSVILKASELAGLTSDELADEFRKAQYVATDQEIKMFSQITSAEGRREFLAKFWTDVEVGRLSNLGVTRVSYLQRVAAANERFRAMGREGWRQDRGRVLILYGEPEEVERFPSSVNGKPYETWHYYGIENGIEFVFIDRSGFGDYILVHSTKRGELRDDQWQRFLQ